MTIATITQAFNTGERKEFNLVGSNFRILESTDIGSNIYLYQHGSEIGRAENMIAGFWVKNEFDKIAITATNACTIKFCISDSESGYDVMAGTVSVSQLVPSQYSNFNNGLATQFLGTSLDAMYRQILPVRPLRKYLLVQNRDASMDVFIAIGNVNEGIRLAPGEKIIWDCNIPTGAINMKTSGGNNANVAVLEGY